MSKLSSITSSTSYTKRNNVLFALVCAILLGLLFLLTTTPAKAQSTETSTDLNIKVTPSINLSLTNCPGLPDANSNSITLNVSPKSSGTFKSNCQDINVQTNTAGYQLLTKVSNTNLTHTTSTANPKPTIPSTSNTFSSPNTIANDTWGYGVANLGSFDTTYTADNANNKYAKLNTTDTQIYNETDSWPLTRTDFKFFYGTKLSLKTNAGSYKTTITYSAIGSEPEAVPEPITTMQDNRLADYCSTSMEIYTNNNDDNKLLTLTDTRNNQQYLVGKLADGKCWMLNNLKIDGTTVTAVKGNATLTPEDTNIAQNFTIPNAGLSTENYFDQPIIDEFTDIPGSGSNQTDITAEDFYGYYYNWCVIKGGTNESCTDENTFPTNTSYDICPVGWRLPVVDGVWNSNSNDFLYLNGMMAGDGGFSDVSDSDHLANWRFNGPFRGVASSSRYSSSWFVPKYLASFWTGTFNSTTSKKSYGWSFKFSSVPIYPPADFDSRYYRHAARCLLQP